LKKKLELNATSIFTMIVLVSDDYLTVK